LHEVDTDADDTFEERTLTRFLIDARNHTGYAQTLRETHLDADTEDVTKTIDYTFGHDEISQTVTVYDSQGQPTSQETHVFGHDGHGSVRVLFDLAAAIVQMYAYEAYGNLLAVQNGTGAIVGSNLTDALTTQLFNGEQADRNTGMLNLRDRWYQMRFGTFDRSDRFFGNLRDPQSLHKHLFTHGDPINGIDPTGLELSLVGTMSATSIGNVVSQINYEMGSAIMRGLSSGDPDADRFFKTMDFVEQVQFWVVVGVASTVGLSGVALATHGLIQETAGKLFQRGTKFAVGVAAHNKRIGRAIGDISASQLRFGIDPAHGYSSFSAFKRVYGEAVAGHAWHHIVEQNQNFTPELLHNPGNVITLPHGPGSIHNQISGFYSSIIPGLTGGLRVREWLRTKSFEEQFEFGIDMIKQFGGVNFLPPHLR